MSRLRTKVSEAALFEFKQNIKKTGRWLSIVFVAGMVVGYLFIYAVSYYNYRDFCTDTAQLYTYDFFNGLGVQTTADMTTVFFDSHGRQLLQVNTAGTKEDYSWVFNNHKLKFGNDEPKFWLVTRGSPFNFVLISGVADSMDHNSENLLHIYYIWGNTNIGVAVFSFILAFFCVFIISCLLVLLYQWKLCEMDTMRRDYVSNVSHELKTPIASIKALTQTLSDHKEKDSETKSRYYGIILSEANRLERAVINLLELNRLQAHIDRIDRSPVECKTLLSTICDKFSVRCDDLGIQFTSDVQDAMGTVLYTNERRITEMMEILLDNAVKFVSTDGGEISLEARLNIRKVTFCVRDNGIGISSANLPHIFDRFYKVNEARGGSGLGLSIAQEICKQLGEDIWVKSQEGHGAAFYFTVSIHKP